MFAALIAVALTVAPARTLRVGPSEAFRTPAAALAAAHAGDTVRIAAGVYRGNLQIGHRVALIGEPGAILQGIGRGTVVSIQADSVELHGLHVRGSGRNLTDDEAAIKLVQSTGSRLVNLRVSESLHGIYLLESSGTELVGNLVEGHPKLPEARRGNGIHLFNSGGNRLLRNTVRGTRDGIYFGFSSGNLVVENDVSRVRYGLHYMYSDDNEFLRNQFTRNAAGAAIMFSKRIIFRDNVFAQHVGYRAYGILLQTAEDVLAERNRIEGNLIGLFLDMSTRNTFRNNAITGNGIGIDMIASTEGNTFTENVITGNRTSVRKPAGAGENQWAENGRGNFWGDRSVFDLDGDGIGDRPFRAGDPFAGLAALRPVLEIFAGTPAARALAWAEEAFPVFNLPRVEDPAPLVAPPAGAPRIAYRP